MKKSLLIEYSAYALVRFLGIIVISLPPKANYTLGKIAGVLGYALLKKKRRLVLKNLKLAFSHKFEHPALEQIAKKAFIGLALNIIETLYIPRMDLRYINRHVRIENLKYLDDALKRGKGVILLAYHLGNWELANVTCGLQGYTYKVIVNEQRYPMLNELLNRYRESKGCRSIARGVALREIIKALKNNEVVAMVGDQGGKEGVLSNFFGLPTSTPSGFVRFALTTGARVIPAIIIRERRFSHRIILEPPLAIDTAEETKEKLEGYLAQSNSILEYYVSAYPQEYFWFYKVWKYSPVKSVVVLSDGKTGHLRQMQAVSEIATSHRPQVTSQIIEVKFRNKLARALAQLFLALDINILEFCLKEESHRALKNAHPDLVISCGASLAGINLSLARENLAKSACIMNPGCLSLKRFDLVIMPKHDRPAVFRKNIAVTRGALNLIDEDYCKIQADELKSAIGAGAGSKAFLGILVGGDTKKYRLTAGTMHMVIQEAKRVCADLDMALLITTSRRTPGKIEELIRGELKDFKACKLLVIANEENVPGAVGGILGLADFIIASGESISMVSEAASSGKYVGVFKLIPKSFKNIKTRHEAFLNNLNREGYIYILKPESIADKVKEVFQNRPAIKRLDDRALVGEAVRKLL